MATQAKPEPRPIVTTVVRSLEPIDLGQWLDRYARAIVEAQATNVPSSPRHPRLHQ